MGYRNYTPAEDDIIRERFAELGPPGLRKLMPHGADSIRQRAIRIGVLKSHQIKCRGLGRISTDPTRPPIHLSDGVITPQPKPTCSRCGAVQGKPDRYDPWGKCDGVTLCPDCEPAYFRETQNRSWTLSHV